MRGFQKKNYHRAIIDDKTGKPFTNFGAWAHSVFGKSQSTIFKEPRILKELQGKVEDHQLAGMRKENASHLADIAAAGEEVTPELVEQAANLPNREFAEKYGSSNVGEPGKNYHVYKLAIDMSPERNLLWQNQVLPAARLRTGCQTTEFGTDDLAMGDIANVYLQAIRLLSQSESVNDEVETARIV